MEEQKKKEKKKGRFADSGKKRPTADPCIVCMYTLVVFVDQSPFERRRQ